MKTILATTDFSSGSVKAVDYAAQLAAHFGSKLLIMHATHIPIIADTYFDATSTMEAMEKADKESMQALTDKLKKKYGVGLKVEDRIEVGFSLEVISKAVKKNAVDLVVMGISHTGKFSEVLFGSTSTELAGNLICPVLIVPEKAVYRPWRKVAFAFDEQHIPLHHGLKMFKGMVDSYESHLHFVNVMSNPYTEFDRTPILPLEKWFDKQKVDVHFIKYIKNKTTELIQDWVRRYKVNATVMIAREHNLLWHLFNERTTKKMAFQTKVPLLVIPEKFKK